MKNIFRIIIVLLIANISASAQDGMIQRFVDEGIQKHDNGDFKGAIESYKKALEINDKSPLANYEIASTYYVMGDYEKSIKHVDKVIKQNKEYVEQAYVLKGTVMDVSGKPKDAVKIYKKGIKDFPNSNLLHYNMALTLYNMRNYKETEEALKGALAAKPTHPSSHFLMAVIMQEQGFRVKSILALYNFLLLEPNSKRSVTAMKLLTSQQQSGVTREGDKKTTIMLSPAGLDDEFSAAELMISMTEASKDLEMNKGKTNAVLFYESTKSLVSVVGNLSKDQTGFWWDFYAKFFDTLSSKSDLEAFSYYISQSKNDPEVQTWLKDNNDKIERLLTWFKKEERKFK